VHEFQYRQVEGEGTIMQYGNKTQVSVALTRMIEQASAEAIAERGAFTLVLSGGSLPTLLNTLVGSKGIEFDKWTVMYVDERNVPHSHLDSTHKLAMDSFLGKVGVPESQILAIQEDLPVEQAATAYAGRMMSLPESVLPRNEANLPILDMILLGIGYDGHVASLFPNTPQTSCKDGSWILPVFNSPKPPPERITMTMPVINSAKNVVMVATGESKAEIVQRTLETQTLPGAVPAQLLAPTSGKLTWILDANSCSLLSPLDWEDKKIWPRSEI
jgi:6-phosphogluconolactonase